MNANDPIEDATANQVIRRDEGDGDLLFFTVMDGHGGYYTSQVGPFGANFYALPI